MVKQSEIGDKKLNKENTSRNQRESRGEFNMPTTGNLYTCQVFDLNLALSYILNHLKWDTIR